MCVFDESVPKRLPKAKMLVINCQNTKFARFLHANYTKFDHFSYKDTDLVYGSDVCADFHTVYVFSPVCVFFCFVFWYDRRTDLCVSGYRE